MKYLSKVFMALSFLCFAVPLFAQGEAAAGATNWVAITAGFSMAIASAVCGLAQAKATAAAAEGLAPHCPILPRPNATFSRLKN